MVVLLPKGVYWVAVRNVKLDKTGFSLPEILNDLELTISSGESPSETIYVHIFIYI